jgi:regulator of cell morphogenesis and NO signaling
MQHFSGTDKLAKLIHSNQFLLPVINRFGIRLGFKDKTVSEVCNELNINENFFLTIVNTYYNEDYFPEADLLSFSPKLIVEYLRKTHAYYFNYLFPEVERRLDRVLTGCDGECDDLQLIKQFYTKYKDELSKHIQEEEDKVFPYIIAITDAWEKKLEIPAKYSTYTVKDSEKEHSNVDQKIYDLKNIVIKYLDPTYNDNDCNAFLYSIFQFERDLLDHARIEDKILVTKVMQIEKILKNG